MHEDVVLYFEAAPEDRRSLLLELHELILSLYPDAAVGLSWKMPTYRQGDGWVSIANQKHYVSLYTCGARHLEEFKARQPGVKTGKGCINLSPDQPLPAVDLAAVVRSAMEERKPG